MVVRCSGWLNGVAVLAVLGLAVGPAYGGFSLAGYDLRVVQSQQGVNHGAASFQTNPLWNSSGLDTPVSTSFTLSGCQAIAYSRLYLDVWGGTNTFTAQVTASLNGTALPTVKIGGTSDKNPTYSTTSTSVYGSGSGVWQIAYSTSNVTSLLHTGSTANVLNFTITDPTGNFDGRVYCATLVTIYTDPAIAGRLDYYLAEADGTLRNTPGTYGSPAQRSVAFNGLNLAGVTSAQYTAEYTHGTAGQHDQVYFNNTALGGPNNDVAVGAMGTYGPDLPTFNVTSLLTSNSTVRYDVANADVGSPGESILRANIGLLTVQHGLTVTASTSAPWVYQNTPVNTQDRHAVALAVSVTQDTWGNHSYTMTVTQTGPGVVTPTAVWTSGTTVTPTLSATWSGLTGYLVGGRVQGGGVVGSAANLAVTGSCSVTVTVVGDVSGPSIPATTTLTLIVAPLGDIDGSGQMDQNDLAILNARLNNFDITPFTNADCDLFGNGAVTTADRVVLNKILNGLAVP